MFSCLFVCLFVFYIMGGHFPTLLLGATLQSYKYLVFKSWFCGGIEVHCKQESLLVLFL